MNKISKALVLAVLLVSCAVVTAGSAQNELLARHAQDFVILKKDKLVPFKASTFLKAPYTVLYFGAGWCPDCVRFSPSLVAEYDRQPAKARRFEVLLLSHDKNAEGMLKFMEKENMRWPALAFDKISAAEDLNHFYSGKGIPCLTVIDPKGAVVLQSKDDQDGNEVLQKFLTFLNSTAKK